MKTNSEIRRETKQILSHGWFGRIASVAIVLFMIYMLVHMAIMGLFDSMDILTLQKFMVAKAEAAKNGLEYALPSASARWSMAGTYAFQQLAGCLFWAIFLFGMATLLLKCVNNNGERWFADSFGGFLRPLEVLWLIVYMNVKVVVWGLLFLVPCLIALYRYLHLAYVQFLLAVVFLVPSIVAMYRYRQAWYLKSENTDWSAARCLSESVRMMKGFKWAAFRLDVWYVLILAFCVMVTVVVATLAGVVARLVVGPTVAAFAVALATLASAWLVIHFGVHLLTARALFYKALRSNSECPAES